MKIFRKRFYLFLALLIFLGFANVKGQGLQEIFLDTPGLQVGMYQGSTDFQDSSPNYYFRLYNQHIFDETRFGEISISSGVISGAGYRSQLTPLEYRLGYHLSKFGIPNPNLFGKKGSFYTYVGLGLLYSRPLEIAAPNDPLTVEMGNRLPSSSFWDFEGGIAPFIPVGAGFEMALVGGAKLNITTGYNQSLNMLKFSSSEVPNGYWGISIGIDFKRERKKEPVRPSPLSPPVLQKKPIIIPSPPPVAASPSLLEKLNRRTINFETLSSTLDEEGKEWISESASILKQNPESPLQVYGHADSIGTEAVNNMISESRARAVWLALIDEGVDASRLNYSWYSDDRPVGTNRTEEGRKKNRRVEFRTVPSGSEFIRKSLEDEAYIVPILRDYEFEKPLFDGRKIDFSETMLGLDDASKSYITVVSYLMIIEPEIEVVIINQVYGGAGEKLRTSLAKARAELIRAELILNGIDATRVQAAIPGSDLYDRYQHHLRGNIQQNILIPVQQKSGNGFEGDIK